MSRASQVRTLCEKVDRDLKLAGLPCAGSSTGTDERWSSITEMWLSQLGFPVLPTDQVSELLTHLNPRIRSPICPNWHAPGLASWYERAYEYWENEENCSLDEDGVLGGYGHISPTDIAGSESFLDNLERIRPTCGHARAADCGAGIGRITKHLLLQRYDFVDLVEQSPRLLRAAPKYIGPERHRAEYLCYGLQDFVPENESYDLVWIQWVVGHCTDVDLLRFIKRSQAALKPGGIIVIKDNVCEGDVAFVVDSVDSSITRSLGYFRSLFNHGGCRIVYEHTQGSFPDEIFPVYMFALE
ncbi:unnamed protein product [Discosporangium mesarthrocarpum]